MYRSFCYYWWIILLSICVSTTPVSVVGQQQTFPYELNKGVDYPLLGAGLLTTGFSIYLDRRTPIFLEDELPLLRIDAIPKIDRHVTRYYSPAAHQFSNVTALASMIGPFALFTDRNNRRDGNGGKLMLITLQGALLNAGLINLTKTAVRRPRPFVFNSNVPLDIKLRRDAKYSFFSGHTAVSSFFAFTGAQMYNDLYPNSSSRGFVWASAAALPLMTGYGRMRAGKHFVTDILVGYGVGALIGILVPRLHRL